MLAAVGDGCHIILIVGKFFVLPLRPPNGSRRLKTAASLALQAHLGRNELFKILHSATQWLTGVAEQNGLFLPLASVYGALAQGSLPNFVTGFTLTIFGDLPSDPARRKSMPTAVNRQAMAKKP